jgi:hypothetical protein
MLISTLFQPADNKDDIHRFCTERHGVAQMKLVPALKKNVNSNFSSDRPILCQSD